MDARHHPDTDKETTTVRMQHSQVLALDESLTDEQFAVALCPHSPIDAGIVRAVRVLWAAGIETFESCEGGPGHAFAEPTVRFHGHRDRGWAAIAALQQLGLLISELRRVWSFIDGEPVGPDWAVVLRTGREPWWWDVAVSNGDGAADG